MSKIPRFLVSRFCSGLGLCFISLILTKNTLFLSKTREYFVRSDDTVLMTDADTTHQEGIANHQISGGIWVASN